nr:hypothetical protein [Tanacetum cinerariifolium]
MAISVISVSSDLSEDNVGTPVGRVILFESDPSEDPSSGHIPPLPDVLPFLSSTDDTIDSDTPDTRPSPTHGTPFTKITSSTQRSPVIPHYRVMILVTGQPIPHDDSARDSSPDSSSVFHSDASSDFSSRHSLSDHSFPDLPSNSVGPSRKRRRSHMTSVPALPPVSGALSPIRADLIPSPKRAGDSGYLADVEGHRIVGVESTVTALTERVAELERDNRRLRGTTSMPNTRSRASMSHEEVEVLVARRVAEEMEVREATRNLETLNENGDEQEGNDLTAYTQRFQELILLCTRMVPDEEDRVERFIRGLLDNIQGNVIAANPARHQDAIRISNQLMDDIC